MTTPIVADASVVCKLYLDEGEESALAKALADQAASVLTAPDLLLVETAGAIFREVRDRRMSRAKGDLSMSDLRARFRRPVPVYELMDAAWNMAMTLRHPVADCAYLALAARKNGLLVTADLKFLRRAKQSRWADLIVSLRDAVAA